MSRLMKQIAIASLALTIAAPAANANLLDSFFGGLFGGGMSGPSGRHQVRLHGNFNPGDIVVSFGDRRLYYIEFEGLGHQLCHCDSQGGGAMVGRELCQREAREPCLDADG